jgi:hypothetical protein
MYFTKGTTESSVTYEDLPLVKEWTTSFCDFTARSFEDYIVVYMIDYRTNKTYFFDFLELKSEEWFEKHFRSVHCSRIFSRTPRTPRLPIVHQNSAK